MDQLYCKVQMEDTPANFDFGTRPTNQSYAWQPIKGHIYPNKSDEAPKIVADHKHFTATRSVLINEVWLKPIHSQNRMDLVSLNVP